MRHQIETPQWHRTISPIGLSVLVVLGGSARAAEVQFNEADFKISLWNYSAALRGGMGYKDNVLLSHSDPKGSSYWMSGGEVMVFRLPTKGWHFNFFAEFEDVRYFKSPSVENEQSAIAVTQLAKELGRGWKSTLSLNYLFQNQVFDNSTLYTSDTSVGLILGHTLTPRWALRKTMGKFFLEGELSGTRQWLDAPLDSYWQYGPRATAGYGWGRGSELSLAYQWGRLEYDERNPVEASGAPILDRRLAFNNHLTELAFIQYWDQRKRWRSFTSCGLDLARDNGSGFYDFTHYQAAQRLGYRDDRWDISGQVRLGHYEYRVQTVSATDSSGRQKTVLSFVLRAERKLSKHWLAHATLGWDRSYSNLEFDDYKARTVTAGLALTF